MKTKTTPLQVVQMVKLGDEFGTDFEDHTCTFLNVIGMSPDKIVLLQNLLNAYKVDYKYNDGYKKIGYMAIFIENKDYRHYMVDFIRRHFPEILI